MLNTPLFIFLERNIFKFESKDLERDDEDILAIPIAVPIDNNNLRSDSALLKLFVEIIV